MKVVQRVKLNRKLLENLESEIQILKKLNHPHIVALKDCNKTEKYIYIIMEYCSVGDLSVIIKKRERLDSLHPCLLPMIRDYPPAPGNGLHEVVVRHFVKQLASALEYLRESGLVHRDVKPQNLLLDPPAGYEAQAFNGEHAQDGSRPVVGLPSLPILKLADFGFARNLPAASLADTLCGSPLYMAPEILRYEKYDATADLWSVGTVVYEMVAGKPPFRAPNHVELLRKIETQNDKINFPSTCTASEEIRGLIRGLLKRSPVERMSFQEFFEHPIITNPIPGALVSSGSGRGKRIGGTSAAKVEATSMMRNPSLRAPSDGRELGTDREGRGAQRQLHPPSPKSRQAVELSTLPFANTGPMPGTPPGLAGVRRVTTTSIPSASPPSPLPRPAMLSHVTTPAWERRMVSPMERVASRNSDPSPGSSLLVQQREPVKERHPKRHPTIRDTRPLEEERVEKDYVIVDKQFVQVNAFADELATRRNGMTPPSPSSSAFLRRPNSGGYSSSPSKAIAVTGRRQDGGHPPRNSYERRYGPTPAPAPSPSPSSTRSALARALELANVRLFGPGLSPPNHSPPNVPSPSPVYPANPASLVMIRNDGSLLDDDMQAVLNLEGAANRSDVVYNFAEVKLAQLMPAVPSNPPHGLGLLPPSASEDLGFLMDAGTSSDMELTPDAIVQLAEEALVLYVKALGLLAKAMDIAGVWWNATSGRNDPMTPATAAAGTRMNNCVQWVRDRFNEVLEKADFVKARLMEAQKELPMSHPSHPGNQNDDSDGSLDASGDRVTVTPGVTAEKLMYDRALEMSRAAAVNELVGDDLPGCEVAYVTSIRMLEAVLEDDSPDRGGDGDGGMEEEDRVVVENCK